jgi:hypothetical protein
MLYQLTGIDLITVPSLKTRTVRTLLSEIGLNLRKWPNTKTPARGARGQSPPQCLEGLLPAYAGSPGPHIGHRGTAHTIARIVHHLRTHRPRFAIYAPRMISSGSRSGHSPTGANEP